MKVVIVSRDDDRRGAALAGVGSAQEVAHALADPDVGLVLSSLPVDSDRVVIIPEGEDADVGKRGGGRRRGA